MNIHKIINNLYKKAKDNGGIDYIFTLLRVTGIQSYKTDPFGEIYENIKKSNDKNAILSYDKFSELSEPLFLIFNLLNCVKKKDYNCSPFLKISMPFTFPPEKISIKDQTDIVIKNARNSKVTGLIKLLNETYLSPQIEIRKKWFLLKSLLVELFERYFKELLSYVEFPKYHTYPNFMVLELLTNNKIGLYGFKAHFSNNRTAVFKRDSNSTTCLNVAPREKIEFFVGNINELKQEWIVNGKPLWKIGLPGRYNKLGEWKPIVYPGKIQEIENRIKQQSDDYNIQGILFYIYTTCYHVIEFVVKTPIDLPIKNVLKIGNLFFLWKCPPLENDHDQSLLYDGWLVLNSIEPEYLEAALEYINLNVNRIGFIYDKPANWCLKYKMNIDKSAYSKVLKKDLKLFGEFLEIFPTSEDSFYLDCSIDWYNHAKISKNPFISFICYYIAIESLAIAITEGKANFKLNYIKIDKSTENSIKSECINKLFKQYYSTDPERFIRESYFNCVLSLKTRMKEVVKILFGKEHIFFELLFKNKNGRSLSDIRSDLAHGRLSMLDPKHRSIVRKRLPEMSEISKEFISRIIYNLDSSDKVPTWSQRHILSLSTSDPRNTAYITHESIFPNKDWRIRKEWCD